MLLAARLRERFGVPGMSVDTVARLPRQAAHEGARRRRRACACRARARVRTETEARAAAEEIGYPLIAQADRGRGQRRHLQGRRATPSSTPSLAQMRARRARRAARSSSTARSSPSTPSASAASRRSRTSRSTCRSRSMTRTHRVDQPRHHHRARPGAAEARSGGIALGRKVLDGARHGRRLHAHGVVPHAERRGRVRRDRLPPRRRAPRRSDELHVRHRSVPRVGARRVLAARSRRRPQRKYNVGIVFKRAKGQGRITRIDGPRASCCARAASYVVEEKLLRPGTPRRNWKQTLALRRLRHPAPPRLGRARTSSPTSRRPTSRCTRSDPAIPPAPSSRRRACSSSSLRRDRP